jgi:hypothetical protein
MQPLGTWQVRLAHVRAAFGSTASTDRDRSVLLEEARSIADEMRRLQQQLDLDLTAAPDVVRSHSRIADVYGALRSIRSKLDEVLETEHHSAADDARP